MLNKLTNHKFYYFLHDYSRYNQIPITPENQERTTFACPFATFAYRGMLFALCDSPSTFKDAC